MRLFIGTMKMEEEKFTLIISHFYKRSTVFLHFLVKFYGLFLYVLILYYFAPFSSPLLFLRCPGISWKWQFFHTFPDTRPRPALRYS